MESVAQSEEQNEILLVKPVRDRNYALDLLRTIASFMVVLIHAAVFYYSCPFLSICQGDGPVWAGVLTALCRSSVPLFVMMTGYFVVPVKENSFSFVKKRFKRVFIPYFFWCVVYAGYNVIEKKMTWIGFFEALIRIPLNYGTDVGHLWYVQMSIGLDLFLPIISPWVVSTTKKGFHCFFLLWGISLFIPYLHLTHEFVFGEAFWNFHLDLFSSFWCGRHFCTLSEKWSDQSY